ncbi:hypothetical protein B0H34DRAFT_392004 [Crassisporium funariophilum]|nr:hypothetical protein B0H34DRAFT_392004 [Crassisporium funariophilum]
MPGEQSPVEFYQYYCASQARVEQWVRSTSQELESSPSTHLPSAVNEVEGRRNGPRRSTPTNDKTHDRSSSRPSSRSKKIDRLPRSKGAGQRYETPDGIIISSYLPYGLLPLLFAFTSPSVATVAAAMILLVGYISVDYNIHVSTSDKQKS